MPDYEEMTGAMERALQEQPIPYEKLVQMYDEAYAQLMRCRREMWHIKDELLNIKHALKQIIKGNYEA